MNYDYANESHGKYQAKKNGFWTDEVDRREYIRDKWFKYYGFEPMEELVARDDPEADFRRYLNIEGVYTYNLCLEDADEFERTHTVIYNEEADIEDSSHYQITDDFVITAFTRGSGLLSGEGTIETLSTYVQGKIKKTSIPVELRALTTILLALVIAGVVFITLRKYFKERNQLKVRRG